MTVVAVASCRTDRRPKVASRSGFTKRESAQMLAGCCRAPHWLASVSFQNSSAAVMHAQNHCGRAAFLGDSANDRRRARHAEA